jgi:serine/threonine-protein kinase
MTAPQQHVPEISESARRKRAASDRPAVGPNAGHGERTGAADDDSIFSLITVAENSDERRAFLRDRLALFFRTVAIISFSFFAISTSVFIAISDASFAPRFGWETRWHLGSVALQFAIWLSIRRGKHSEKWLTFIDTAGTLLTCVAYAMMVLYSKGEGAPLVGVIPTLVTLVTHAVLIPSAPRRTLLLTSVSFLPIIFVTFAMGRIVQYLRLNHVLAGTIYITTWGIATVAIATLTSRIIYGLEQKVREARQLGQYTLAERIGAGGMGVVYRARHAMLRRPTAVKVLPPDKMGEQNLRRFEREVQLTSQLTHPNTISIYDYGRTADGLFYYAMEYLDGFTLAELVEVAGPLPGSRVAALMRQVSGSIHEAHTIGLIHRDIKPDNIIVCERGGMCDVVKVLDFGLVKDIRSNDPALSQVNAIIGTPHYMSPEAITNPSQVGVPSDIYSLGATAYYLLAGRHVFQARTLVEICSHHLMTTPRPPSAVLGHPVSQGIEQLVLACLAKSPAQRPPAASALERAFAAESARDPWTQDAACAWWSEHREALARLRASRATTAPLADSAILRSATFSSKTMKPIA